MRSLIKSFSDYSSDTMNNLYEIKTRNEYMLAVWDFNSEERSKYVNLPTEEYQKKFPKSLRYQYARKAWKDFTQSEINSLKELAFTKNFSLKWDIGPKSENLPKSVLDLYFPDGEILRIVKLRNGFFWTRLENETYAECQGFDGAIQFLNDYR